eukprot:169895-Chlamydomonas_euryale.AAC.5
MLGNASAWWGMQAHGGIGMHMTHACTCLAHACMHAHGMCMHGGAQATAAAPGCPQGPQEPKYGRVEIRPGVYHPVELGPKGRGAYGVSSAAGFRAL